MKGSFSGVWRAVVPYLWLLLVLIPLAGFTWLTHHPRATILARAEGWPGIGPLAQAFRQRYAPAGSGASEPGEDAGPARNDATDDLRRLPPSAWIDPPMPVGETMWLLAGAVLRHQPSHDAPLIETLDGITNVIQLEQRDDWYRVFRHGYEGWVYVEDYATTGPPYGETPDAPGPLLGRPPDEHELAAALELLGSDARSLTLGPYSASTDCQDATLLRRLDLVAKGLESAYVTRYDRQPVGSPMAAVVLFARRQDYQRLRDARRELAGLPASGHHSQGLIAFYVGRRSASEVIATFIHEVVHTFNRRALGPALPPWLDEGLADDLAVSQVDAEGQLDPMRLAGEIQHLNGRFTMHGAFASLTDLDRARRGGRLPSLDHLMAMDWDAFVRSEDISLHYDLSAFWLRYLLQGQGGRHSAGLRAFLDHVAEGGEVTAAALADHLQMGLPWLEGAFHGWLDLQVRQYQLPTTGLSLRLNSDSSSRHTDSPSL